MLLIGAKPVPLARKMIGLSLSSRRKNVPSGPSKRRMSRLLHLVEDVVGERTAGHVAHVQLDVGVVLGRVGHRVGAPLAVAHDDLEVLPGQKLQPLVGGQVRYSTATSCDGTFDALHAAGQLLDRKFAGRVDLARLDHQVGQRLGLAEQREAELLLELGQDVSGVLPVVHLALRGPCPCRRRRRRCGSRRAG